MSSTNEAEEAARIENEKKELNAKVELLRGQIQRALEEKEAVKKCLEAAQESEKNKEYQGGLHRERNEMVFQTLASSWQPLIGLGNLTEIAKMESELLMQRDMVQRQVELLAQQKTLQEAAIKELHDLDK